MSYQKTLSQRWRTGGLEETTGMDARVLFWAFLRPFLNGVIGVVLLLINYFGLGLIAGFLAMIYKSYFQIFCFILHWPVPGSSLLLNLLLLTVVLIY